ncbi:ferrochelatase [Bacteriovoracaceae bacterium]|nr:ferrochelatase [Bacteriovoracaceae bacterium]
MKTGILIANLGTPDSTKVSDVGRYLVQFLMDKHIIQLPLPLRFLLVWGIIVPFRSKKSAHAYKKIWNDNGAPLRTHTIDLSKQLGTLLPNPIAYGMRYGNPSISNAVKDLVENHKVDRILLCPMFPQNSTATILTLREEMARACSKYEITWETLPEYYKHPTYISTLSDIYTNHIKDKKIDHTIISFHGLPESHLKKENPHFCLEKSDCCELVTARNEKCYKHQCMVTAKLLASKLNLSKSEYTVSFQSRLGRNPWLTPNTEDIIKQLGSKTKSIAITTPGFSADCLETIEELGIQGRKVYLDHGGEEFTLIPSTNASPIWVNNLSKLIQQQL